jgi:hypothetical protein
MSTLKKSILLKCHSVIDEKIHALNTVLRDLTEAGNNETKSSAGDKHETARAMMQLEQEKLGNQIQEWEIQKNVLAKIDGEKTSSIISLGSLVESNNGYFFIAANIGKIQVGDSSVMVISTQSPLGLYFLNRTIQQEFIFNQTEYVIKNVW